MTSEKLSLVVTDSCLLPAKRIPEDSEMIINTDYLTGLIFSDPAELVISSYKIPAHMMAVGILTRRVLVITKSV